MKQIIIAAVIAGAALAACNGGSSTAPAFDPGVAGPTASPSPTVTPTVAPLNYSARITWTGVAEPKPGTVAAHAKRRGPRDVATPYPVVLAAVDAAAGFTTLNQDTNAVVSVVVSPTPSSQPAASWSVPSVVTQYPTPSPSPGTSPPPPAVVVQSGSQIGNGTIAATISAPVNGTTTTNVLVFARLTMGCHAFAAGSAHFVPAVKYTGTTWQPAADAASADLYLTGPDCPAPFTDAGVTTLHVPHGLTVLSSANIAYLDVTSASYSSSPVQSVDIQNATNSTVHPNGTTPDTLVFNVATGQRLVWYFTSIIPGPVPSQVSGVYRTL